MTALEFLIVFSIPPIGALVIAAVFLYLTRRDAAKADNPHPR